MKQRHNWAELAAEAANEGDLEAAKRCLVQAIKQDKNNHVLRFHYGAVLEAAGDRGAAAEQFTETLRIEPTAIDAARRLGRLVSMGLPADVELNVWGLKAALTHHDFVNRDQIAEAGVYYLSRKDPLKSAFEFGRANGWREAARQLCLKKTAPLLRDDLFLLALRDNIIRMPELEQLLTEVRRVLLVELPHTRFEDRALAGFLTVLMQQCWVNEYVWPVTQEEKEALRAYNVSTDALFQGSAQGSAKTGLQLAIAALYQPVSALLGESVTEENLSRIRPHVVGDAVRELVGQQSDETARAAKITKLGTISDPTSVKVAAQYSRYPYPRWTSLGYMLRPGEWRKMLEQYFTPERLQFMDRPFEVLIAGSGTGRQVIAEAHAYGPNARITAIDLSMPSLAYAARMAEYYCATGIEFCQGDIREIVARPDFASRFDIIECVGVLHHMAEPLQTWQALTKCLADDGIMLIGLYSAIARRNLAKLRQDPANPGPGCDDDALRGFRQTLLAKGDREIGSEFRGIKDIYTTSGFRDLLLHECEHDFTLPQISKFLDANGLVFRGFQGAGDLERLRQLFPGEEWPGDLLHWAKAEEQNPSMFTSMY
jgi:SAM-dependent methyltransferase/tetratricopeptide (TPR) repeat protein